MECREGDLSSGGRAAEDGRMATCGAPKFPALTRTSVGTSAMEGPPVPFWGPSVEGRGRS